MRLQCLGTTDGAVGAVDRGGDGQLQTFRRAGRRVGCRDSHRPCTGHGIADTREIGELETGQLQLATQGAHQPIHALAHITGGGLPGNLPRVLPEGCDAIVDESSWTWPPLFQWLQQQGNVDRFEMYRTFNCGVGMVVVVPAEQADAAIAQLASTGDQAWVLGRIVPSTHSEPTVVFA